MKLTSIRPMNVAAFRQTRYSCRFAFPAIANINRGGSACVILAETKASEVKKVAHPE
jgi:hypothetical protein